MNKEIEKAISVLLELKEKGYKKFEVVRGTNYAYIEIDPVLTALESQQSDMWIPVTEHLPEETGHYLVTVVYKKDKQTQVESIFFAGAELDENPEWKDTFFRYRDVKAWRYLPEPYEEVQP